MDKPADPSVVKTLATVIPEVRVTLTDDGRQLLVVARLMDQTVVKALVDQWKKNVAEQAPRTLKVYPLARSFSTAEVAALSSLVPGAEITASQDSRQLSVIATATDQTAVETLIKQFAEAEAAQENRP